MPKALLALALASSAALCSSAAGATVRSFAYTQESLVLAPSASQLTAWTTYRAGQSRYYSALDGRLELAHGLGSGLELGLFWNFASESRDVVTDSLTQELERKSSSELASASAELKYLLGDRAADLVGSALRLAATLGPRQSELEVRVIVDRSWGKWLIAANAAGVLELVPRRGDSGSELDTAVVLEPTLAAGYELSRGASLGVELRAPLGLSGDAKSSTLFGGPVLRWADQRMWASLGALPQLLAFSGKSAGSRLDLNQHQRLEVRLLAGFLL
jgi:hypothetical protein